MPLELRVGIGATVHSLALEPSSHVRDAKALLQALTGATPQQQKLLHKGKELKDDNATLEAAGVTDGSKAMLLFAAGFVRQSVVASGPASTACAPVAEPAAAPSASAKRVLVDESESEDTFPLNLVCAGVTYGIRISAGGTVRDAKLRAASLTGAPVAQQRLIVKGKERADAELLASLELACGAQHTARKVMILFRAGFHLEAEGATIVRSMVGKTLELEGRLDVVTRKQKHRVAGAHEMLALVGALDEDARAVLLDLENASVNPEIDAQRRELLERVKSLLDTTFRLRRDIRP
jgi:hypothetical protein